MYLHKAALRTSARQMHVLVGRNTKRVGDVDETRLGTFLFNHFVAIDPVLGLRDYMAGWYANGPFGQLDPCSFPLRAWRPTTC